MNFFSCRTRLFFGEGALSQLAACKAYRVLVVTDRFFADSGLAEKIGAMVPGASVTVFSRVIPDPTAALAARGCAVLEKLLPDVVIALGGGSPIDCAKTMLAAAQTRPFWIAIPTTSGSGSELTSFAIVSHEGRKQVLADESLLPDWAILDPALLQTLPPPLIADTGFDVLAHDLEALAATGASPFSDALATGSFRGVYGHLRASYEGDGRVRGLLHECASMAGLAFEHAGLGVCHALSHALGGQFSVPHGRLNAVLLLSVLAYNQDSSLAKYADLARQCGGSGGDRAVFRSFLGGLTGLRRSLGLPATLSQAGIAPGALEQAMDALARAALDDACCKTNPRPPTADDLKALLRQVK